MRVWIAVCALAIVITPGCTKPQESESGAKSESQMKPESSDDKIVKEVKAKLAADPALKAEPIQVAVKDGRVTLTGTVSSDAIKSKADSLVREIPDVFGVDAEKLVTK